MEKKKNRFWKALAILFMLALLANWTGPRLLLKAATQPEPAEEYAYSEAFENTYEDVRAQLQERVATLEAGGAQVQTYSHPIDEQEGLYIDNVYLPATDRQTNLIVLTTGVHGITDPGDTFWVRYDAASDSMTDVYDDGNYVDSVPFRSGETYLLMLVMEAQLSQYTTQEIATQ